LPSLFGATALLGMKAIHQDLAFIEAVNYYLAGLKSPPEVLMASQRLEDRIEHLLFDQCGDFSFHGRARKKGTKVA
jgi:hypothetical protein